MPRLLDILSGIGNTLDVPGSMVRDALGGENPFDQLAAPWRANNRLSGRDLARRYGMASQEDTWGNLAGGIGIELATDPLNFVPGLGLVKRALQGSKIAKATKAVDQANSLSQAMRLKGWMPEEVAQATKIRSQGNPAAPWEVFDPKSGEVVDRFADEIDAVRATSGSQWDYAKTPVGPTRLYHETAAPPFGSHEFLPDPGTNNWLGKGTYFTKQPGEAAGAYSKWDKSKTILPKDPEEAKRIAEALAGKGTGAPRTMMSYVDARNPYTFEEPASIGDIRVIAGSRSPVMQKPPTDVAWKPVGDDLVAKHGNREYMIAKDVAEDGTVEYTVLSEPLQWNGKNKPRAMHGGAETLEEANRIAKWAMNPSSERRELAQALRLLRSQGEPVTKGDVWALLRDSRVSSDETSDVIRNAGYDALQHEAGTGTRLQERMYDIGRKAPDIDEHSELVAFSPSQIYEPFIAPALKPRPEQLKPIPKSLMAALAGYQAGVIPARGRKQE
jgi:hypothetical protein